MEEAKKTDTKTGNMENKKPIEQKPEVAEQKIEEKKETNPETKKSKTDNKEKGSESKASESVKKTEAVVNAKSLPISTKHSIAICNMIRGKDIDKAILLLEQAEKKKIPVPMRGEIPHRKGIMSGRFPINALGYFIKTLKSLKANALVNELELEKFEIFCKANLASRPYRRFGKGKFKRTHLTVKLIPFIKKKTKKANKKKQGENYEK